MTEPAQFPDGGSDLAGVLDDVPLTAEESLDSDDLGDTDAGRDPLDDSWDAPDRPSAEVRHRPTAADGLAGGSLDDQLAQEVPDVDPYLEAERTESGLVLEDDVLGDDDDVLAVRPGGLVADGDPLGDQLTGRSVGAAGDPSWPLAAEDDALHLD
jgi:hypothetical protein